MRSLVFLIVLLTSASFIVIRHDRNDQQYLDFGKQFSAVCKVGDPGGDGVLIGANWVLTAAHVADGLQQLHGKNFNLYFEGKAYAVDAIFIHPDFAPMGPHDIALIRTTTPITMINPIKLYRQSAEAGKEIVIVGHGDFKTGIQTKWLVDGKRRAATNRVDDVNGAHLIFHFDDPKSKNATELEGTAGRGDSGGPAFIKEGDQYLVAGISSAGKPGENGPGTYGAEEHYTRVSTHLAWIDEILGGRETSVASRPAQRAAGRPLVLPGLGLILSERNNKVMIEGKVDPEVPIEFREVIFGQGSFIVSLNQKEYFTLQEFQAAFKAIKPGEKYQIEFSVKGTIEKFESVR
jgi:hypothetical protein